MCRLLAYLGQPVLMDKFLYEPDNSMIKQSFEAKEIEEPLNGDGFGVGWYHKHITHQPAVFVSIYPAWNNRNLRYLASLVQSDCLIAHVRAASVGDVSESNCHPFHYRNYLMAHNGGVEEFDKIKRSLKDRLSDERYLWLKGQTDSEHLFALFLEYLSAKKADFTADDVADSFEEMIVALKEMMEAKSITAPAYLNMVFVDGERMVGLRYTTSKEVKPLTLYYSEGSKYVCEDGVCYMVPSEGSDKSVMIVSEKLTDIAQDWKTIPDNHMVLVYKDLSVKLRKVEV
ncbi:class II glutamine amidotransferase [Fulvivirga kasyanovii]|uniref:Class II glutamine amidotransferase n=1 Tax=Fulvivirga kasyanovii TaxID=396812 RepID=A0ABW9RUH1_9BACT|nr:class II glutamine amidotransferase [Fulvivirga kasyanovii]MTI27706.1 class II glutamine amidotransferase [Fulvivirga kasyanovii]